MKSIDFFNEILLKNDIIWNQKKVSLIIVAHIIPDMVDFLDSLSKFLDIVAVIPKPNSIHKRTYDYLKRQYPFWTITKDDLRIKQTEIVKQLDGLIDDKFLIVDIGWYFSTIAATLSDRYGDRFLGIIEDTENGLQKYEKSNNFSYPFVSVARSILKESEDFLVWESIVFSTEFILRSCDLLLKNRRSVVIWFWKIWRSIARQLYWKNISLWIYDWNPYKGVEALTYWYDYFYDKKLIYSADIIFCATGNFSLKWDDFLKLKDWCVLASVTSSDDELDVSFLNENFKKVRINEYVDSYSYNWKTILLLNHWNAVNFVIQTWVGFFIRLLQGEIIHLLILLIKLDGKQKGYFLLSNEEKQYIAEIRLKYFIS